MADRTPKPRRTRVERGIYRQPNGKLRGLRPRAPGACTSAPPATT